MTEIVIRTNFEKGLLELQVQNFMYNRFELIFIHKKDPSIEYPFPPCPVPLFPHEGLQADMIGRAKLMRTRGEREPNAVESDIISTCSHSTPSASSPTPPKAHRCCNREKTRSLLRSASLCSVYARKSMELLADASLQLPPAHAFS
jgi:hypothetical protein